MKAIKYVLYLVLAIGIAASAYFLYNTIGTPINERKAFNQRSEEVKAKLENIAEAQKAYYDVHGEYAGDFTSLKNTILTGERMELMAIGDPYDTTVIMRIDTLYVPVKDKVDFDEGFDVNTMNLIPHSSDDFRIVEKKKIMNEIEVSVFEVSVRNEQWLTDLMEKGYTFDYDKSILKDSLMVGSLSKQISTGNWQ